MSKLSEIRDQYPQYADVSDRDLAEGIYSRFYSDVPKDEFYSKIGFDQFEDERTIGGSVTEFAKAIPRGFAGSFLSAGEGLAELADAGTNLIGLEDLIDSGNDNELVRLAREGRDAMNSGVLGVDRKYQDQWSTKFGEGLGSLASFFTPAGAVKLAGLAGKTASTTQLVGGLTLAGGTGAGDQAQRIQAARDSGIGVSQAQEDASIGLGTLVGFTEMAPVGNLLRRITKSAPKEFVNSIKSRLASAAKSGGFEGLQEVSANIAQNAIERGFYNENLAVNDSLYDALASDEFTVGAASGFVADLVLNSVASRRNRYASQADKEYESGLREDKEVRIKRGEQAVSDFQEDEALDAQQEQALNPQITEATLDPSQIDPPTPQQVTRQLEVVNAKGKVTGTTPLATQQRGRYLDVVDSTNPEEIENYQASERVRNKKVKGQNVEIRYILDINPNGTTSEKIISVNGQMNPNIQVQELVPQSKNLQMNRKTDAPTEHANFIYNLLGKSFPTAGTFQVDMPSADNPSVAPNQVVHVSPDGKKTPFGRNVQSFEDASVIAGRLNSKIIDSQVTNSVAQAINTAPESYSPEVKSTLVVYGDTILHPDESTFTASSIDTAAGTTIAEGFQENRLAKDLVAEGVPRKNLTASQKINADRISKGLAETSTFTPAEAKAVLKDNFSRLIRAPETLETAIYKTKKVKNKKTKKDEFILISENGDQIKDRPPTGREAMEQLQPEGGRRRNITFKTRGEAQSYAKQLNAKEGIDPRNIILENDDRTAKFSLTPMSVVKEALSANNITNDINSPELRALAENFTGVKATGRKKIGDMNKGELKALVSGLRSLPRFDVPTRIPLFKHNKYTSGQFGAALEFVKQNDNDTTNLAGIAESIGLDFVNDPEAIKIAKALAADLEVHIAPLKLVPKAKVEEQGEPLLLESPAPTVDINKLTALMNARMSSFGLTDIPARIDYALRHVARNAQGELVFGIRQSQYKGTDGQKLFDSNGLPLMGATREEINTDPNYVTEAFYSPDVNGVFLAVDTVAGIKDMTPEQQEAEFIRLLDHEMIHGMRQLDLWTEKEWQLLSSLAGTRKNKAGITFLDAAKASYTGAVIQVEEAIAEMTREARADPKILTGQPRTLVNRIKEFFTKSVSAINGFGFNSFGNIIQGIESGEIGSRSRGEIRTLLESEREQGVPFFNARQALKAGVAQEDQSQRNPVTRQGMSDSEGLGEAIIDDTIAEVDTLSDSDIMESRRRLSTPIQNAIELSKTKYAEYSTRVEEEFFGKFWPSVMQEIRGTVTPDKVRTAAKRALKDIEGFVSDNPKYKDYYQEDMRAIKALLESEFGPMSTGDILFYQVANGLNSPATTLTANVGDAINVFDLYQREGNLDSIQMGVSAKGNPVVASSNPFKLSGTSGSNKARTLKIIDGLAKEMGGMEQAINFMKETVTAEELQAFNRKMGYKTPIDLKPIKSLVELATGQNELIPRMFIFGKKIGAYTLNLTGDSRYTTIDVWESRFIRSYFEGLFEKNTGIPVNVAEDVLFQDFSRVFKEEYDKLTGTNADPASLQAMRWFYMINAAKQSGYRGASTDETISELTNKQLTRLRKNRNVGRSEDNRSVDKEIQKQARVQQEGQQRAVREDIDNTISEADTQAQRNFVESDIMESREPAAYLGASELAQIRNTLVDDVGRAGLQYDERTSEVEAEDLDLEKMSPHGRRLIKALAKDDYLGYDRWDDALLELFDENFRHYDPSQNLKRALGHYVNQNYALGFGPSDIMESRRIADSDVPASSVLQFAPWEPANQAATSYAQQSGIEYTPPNKHVMANPERGAEIAVEYDAMEHAPNDPLVKEAYQALVDESLAQYEYLLGTGLQIEMMPLEDPYDGKPSNAIKDIKKNNHLYVFPTSEGYGPSDQKFSDLKVTDFPLLAETQFTDVNGVPMLANDVFRAVHDFYGHVKSGTTFRATGEENAWQNHAAMFSPLARRAMTTETRGQNSWVNFGPFGESNRTAQLEGTKFAVQKTGLMPIWTSEENRISADVRQRRFESSIRDASSGLTGAVDGNGRIELTHYSHKELQRGNPRLWGTGLSKNTRGERDRLKTAPPRTYFGVESGVQNGYRKERGLGNFKHTAEVDASLLYDWNADPDGFYIGTPIQKYRDHAEYENRVRNAGYLGYYVNDSSLGLTVAVFDSLALKSEALSSKEVAKDFLSDGFNPKSTIPEIPEGAIESVVEANLKKAKDMPSNQVPEFSTEADPRSQYVAQNPDKGAKLSPEDNNMYSVRKQPEYNPRAKAALDKLVTPTPKGPASRAYLDVTQTTPIGEFFVRAKAKLINRYARLEQIYNDPNLGFRDVLADSSAMAAALFADRSKGIASEAIKSGFVSYKNGITKVQKFTHKGKAYRGLIDVMSPLFQNRYGVDLEQLAQGYAVAKRSERLKAEGKAVPADAASLADLQSEVNKYTDENGNSIIEEWFSAWQAYNSKTVEFLMDTGVLDAETAQVWMDQSDYVPFYRQAENPDAPDKMPSVFKGMTSAATFKELKGGETAVTVPLLDAITRNLDAAISMGMRNVAQQRIVRDMKSIGLAREVTAGQVGNNIISFRVDGVKRNFAIDDPLMFESMQLLGGGSLESLLTSVVGVPSRVLREMITREPGFMMVNMLRDTLSTYVTSGAKFIPIYDTLKNATSGVDALSAYGVVGGYDFGNDPDNMFKDFEKEMRKRGQGGSGNIFGKVWDFLGEATTASDAATRKAVYDDVLARTGNEAEAAFQALEVINFSRRGNSPVVRVITAAIPFLNARFQGLDVFIRAGRGNYSTNKDMSQRKQMQVVAMRGLTLASLTALYFLLVSDDDQYKEADEHTRDNNWLIPTSWGVPFKVPIPFEVGLLFKTLPEKALAIATGESTGREALQSSITAATGTLAINPFGAQIVKPLIEAGFNHNFFTGNAIVSKYVEDNMQAAFMEKDTTNRAAVEIGKMFDINPVKLEHVMKGYTGTIGSYVLDVVDSTMRSPALSGDTGIQMPTRPITEFPIIKRFFARNNNSGQKEDFYELHGEIKKITATLNKLKGDGRIDEYKRYLEGREVLYGLRHNTNYVADQLSKIRNRKSQVLKSDLSPDEKREIIDQLIETEKKTLKMTSVLKKQADLPVFDRLYR